MSALAPLFECTCGVRLPRPDCHRYAGFPAELPVGEVADVARLVRDGFTVKGGFVRVPYCSGTWRPMAARPEGTPR